MSDRSSQRLSRVKQAGRFRTGETDSNRPGRAADVATPAYGAREHRRRHAGPRQEHRRDPPGLRRPWSRWVTSACRRGGPTCTVRSRTPPSRGRRPSWSSRPRPGRSRRHSSCLATVPWILDGGRAAHLRPPPAARGVRRRAHRAGPLARRMRGPARRVVASRTSRSRVTLGRPQGADEGGQGCHAAGVGHISRRPQQVAPTLNG